MKKETMKEMNLAMTRRTTNQEEDRSIGGKKRKKV
jgi:hypothetical protein